tara:strand:+ start:25282 stop:25509 length:228 start_codon:yes stop_codon:yes gene_type:complete
MTVKNKPVPNIPKRCLKGYPPKKTRIIIIENNNAAEDRLAGRISSIELNTGSQSGRIEVLNLKSLKFSFEMKWAT